MAVNFITSRVSVAATTAVEVTSNVLATATNSDKLAKFIMALAYQAHSFLGALPAVVAVQSTSRMVGSALAATSVIPDLNFWVKAFEGGKLGFFKASRPQNVLSPLAFTSKFTLHFSHLLTAMCYVKEVKLAKFASIEKALGSVPLVWSLNRFKDMTIVLAAVFGIAENLHELQSKHDKSVPADQKGFLGALKRVTRESWTRPANPLLSYKLSLKLLANVFKAAAVACLVLSGTAPAFAWAAPWITPNFIGLGCTFVAKEIDTVQELHSPAHLSYLQRQANAKAALIARMPQTTHAAIYVKP